MDCNMFGVPIVCIFEKGSKVSPSLDYVAEDIISYKGSQDMIEQIAEALDLL